MLIIVTFLVKKKGGGWRGKEEGIAGGCRGAGGFVVWFVCRCGNDFLVDTV